MTASIEIQHLAQQWAEDRDSMSDEAREALLGWIQDLRRWMGLGGAVVVVWVWLGFDLGLSGHLAEELCEEAGVLS